MTRLIIPALVALLIALPLSAKSKTYAAFLQVPCSAFTDLYAKSGLEWEDKHIPSWRNDQFGVILGWIAGYLTFVNKHEVPSGDVFADRGLSASQSISWIGSWCRDHPDDTLSKALDEFIGPYEFVIDK